MAREKYWYKEAIIYEVHVKSFFDSDADGTGDFKGLTEKLDYLQDLGITAIWLLPFYPSPLRDDGYDIADYLNVHPPYGNLKDFKSFLKEAHKRGLKVITELVINHTSDQHIWFQKAKTDPKWRDYYVWSDTPDKYQDARIIFQDFEHSNWSWDPESKSYYWHRFYSHQPDLNFDNPEIHEEIFKVLNFWLEMGVDGVRLDAVPYLYEREHTTCENLEETHAFLKKLRKHVDDHFSERMLLAEANQWPEDACKYFGDANECHMAFHFPVMPRLFMAIHLEDSLPIVEIMQQTPDIPFSCQWAFFLRNHDELTLEMVTDEERDYMFRVYAHDPQARLNLGIRRRLAPLLKNDRRKIELMNSLLFSLTGTPVLYYGDEIGMGDNIYLGDRDGVRTPMQWSLDRNAGFSKANPQQLYLPPIIDPEYHFETLNVEAQTNNPYSLLWWTKQLISLRKRFKAFSYGTTRFLLPENRKVLVFLREFENEKILIVANLSRFAQFVELDLADFDGFHLIELFSGQRFPNVGELPYFLTLGPYGYYWFALEKEPKESALALLDRERERQIHTIKEGIDPTKIFSSKSRKYLDTLVTRYIAKRIWFKDKLPFIDKTKSKIIDHISLPEVEGYAIHLVLIEIVLTNTEVERYPLFLTLFKGEKAEEKAESFPENVVAKFLLPNKNEVILFELGEQHLTGEILLDIMNANRCYKGEHGRLCGILLTPKTKRMPFSFIQKGKEIKDVIREKEATYFPVQNKMIKLLNCVEEGMHLDIEIRTFLSEKTEFTDFIPLLGVVEYRFSDEKKVALAEEVLAVPKEASAKNLTLEEAERFLLRMEAAHTTIPSKLLTPKEKWVSLAMGELKPELHHVLEGYLEVSRLLGETTAKFHLAMSSDKVDDNFAPVAFSPFYQRSLYQNMRRKLTEGFAQLRLSKSRVSSEFEEELIQLFALEDKGWELLQVVPKIKVEGIRLRYHGNYTLDNFVYTGKNFLITNFSGKEGLAYSERRFKRPALCDLAQMVLSIFETGLLAIKQDRARGMLANKSKSTLRQWAMMWATWISSSFIRSYLRTLKDTALYPTNLNQFDFLLALFMIESCVEKICKDVEGDIEAPLLLLSNLLEIYEPLLE